MHAFFANIFLPKNFKPKTQLCNFWCQNIGAKCARKMLMKSTPGGLNVAIWKLSIWPAKIKI